MACAIGTPVEGLKPAPDVISPAVIADLTAQRARKKVEFGWKASYGVTTSMEKGNEKRREAEAKADDWFFAQLGRACAAGQELLAMRAHFDTAKADCDGKLVSTEEGNGRRHEAELKAVKYSAEKFGKEVSQVEAWLVAGYR